MGARVQASAHSVTRRGPLLSVLYRGTSRERPSCPGCPVSSPPRCASLPGCRCGGRATRPSTRASWHCMTPCPQSEPGPLLRCTLPSLHCSTAGFQHAGMLGAAHGWCSPAARHATRGLILGSHASWRSSCSLAPHVPSRASPSPQAARGHCAPCAHGTQKLACIAGLQRRLLPSSLAPSASVPPTRLQAHCVLRRRRGGHAPPVAARRAHPPGLAGGAVAARRGAGAAAPGRCPGAAAQPRAGAARSGEAAMPSLVQPFRSPVPTCTRIPPCEVAGNDMTKPKPDRI